MFSPLPCFQYELSQSDGPAKFKSMYPYIGVLDMRIPTLNPKPFVWSCSSCCAPARKRFPPGLISRKKELKKHTKPLTADSARMLPPGGTHAATHGKSLDSDQQQSFKQAIAGFQG